MTTINKLITTGVFLSILLVIAVITPGTVYAQSGCLDGYRLGCSGNNDLYWFDSCGTPQTFVQHCDFGCSNGLCGSANGSNYNNNYVSNYTYHSYQSCNGNSITWYDSNGHPNDTVQYCSNGCYNNTCQNNYINYGSSTDHAYKGCVGNSIYWYNSNGYQQDFYYNCANSGQTCQYGQCVGYIQPVQQVQVLPAYVAHYTTKCYGISLYWYDTLGVFSGLNKDCSDKNSCTLDTCSGNKCSNTLKCDGSTCATDSDDYKTYCAPKQAETTDQTNSTTTANTNTTPDTNSNANTNTNANANANAGGLSIALFAKQDINSNQWQKTAQVGANGQIYFMISVVNNSKDQIDNVNISANIPTEISSLGNLQLNGVAISGDIVSGINIGSLVSESSKSITFEGRTQTISATATKPATATSNVAGTIQSDSISISLTPEQAATAAVSAAPATAGFWGFLKRWYLWILGAVVLVFLFVVVFKRLSTDV